METLCKIRDIYRAIAEFELQFEKRYHLNLNEGMVLCSLLKNELLTSGEIATLLGLTASNASKVICSAEHKGLVKRTLGRVDKRQMYFALTPEGQKRLQDIQCNALHIPELLEQALNCPIST